MSFSGRVGRVTSRRKPAAPPAIAAMSKNALQAVEQLPPELRESMRAVIVPLAAAAVGQDTFNRKELAGYDSFPAPHRDTHAPDSPVDPLLVEAPVAIGTANDVGSSNRYNRADHVHKRNVEISNGPFIRRKLTLGGGLDAVDTDASTDAILVDTTWARYLFMSGA